MMRSILRYYTLLTGIVILFYASFISETTAAIISTPLVSYTADVGDEFTGVSSDSRLLATPLAGSGAATLEAGARLLGAVFLDIEVLSTGPADSIANQQYFQFSLSAASSSPFKLTSLSLDASRGGSSTPRGWILRSSIDGFATTIMEATIPTAQPDLTNFNIDLPQEIFAAIDNSVTFRIYGYAPSSPGVGIYFDNIVIEGSVIPEPSGLFLAVIGSCFLFFRRGR